TPKLLSSLPDGSNCRIGGWVASRPMQVAWPGGTVLKQRWKTQILPSRATITRMTSPQRPPFISCGSVGQPSTRRYGLESSAGLGYEACCACAAADIARSNANTNPARLVHDIALLPERRGFRVAQVVRPLVRSES